jgi:uncharacterized protein YidB (DUF937 family)
LEAIMGLLDILNGMQNGPRGQTDPNAKGGMSPITMAILALLAYKAYQKVGGAQAPATPDRGPAQLPDGGTANAGLPGGLGDLLKSGLGGNLGNALGGLLAGGAAGGLLSGGLNDLLKGFQQNGLGDIADSWVGKGANKDISVNDLAKAIGIDDIDAIAGQTGLSRDDLLTGLRQQLPQVIDHLTPDGRLPTEKEAARLL